MGRLEPIGCRIGLYMLANDLIVAVLPLELAATWAALFCQPGDAVPVSPAQGPLNVVGMSFIHY